MSSTTAPGEGMGSVARGGAFVLIGSLTSAAMGLLLVVVLGRVLGASDAGIVFQGIAAFTIAMSVARFGLDTTAVWLLPRLRSEDASFLRAAVVGILWPTVVLGLIGWGMLYATSLLLDAADLGGALRAMAWALPFAGVTMVGLAATRALGGVRPFVLVQSIGIPSARPALALLVTAAGGASAAVAASWVLPLAISAPIVLLVLAHQLVRHAGPRSAGSTWRPTRVLTRRIFGYALPRAVATVLEQAMTWLDVLLVGLLAGPAAAGIYGAATRFTQAGLIMSTSLRIVVAPMFSRHLGSGELPAVRHLYTTTTKWIIAVSVPIYLGLALFGGTVISLLGAEFREGGLALGVLAGGMVLVLSAGNIQSVLLMSGHSSLAALNKFCAVLVTVGLLLLLLPEWGIVGAAAAWVVGMGLDTGLAAWQVHRRVGVQPWGGGVLKVLALTLWSFGLPALGARLLGGDELGTTVVGVLLGSLCLALTAWRLAALFQVAALGPIIRSRKGKP
ncbi:polysaccharide biosynthesis C-terminal domain-containing protein [Serinicoccus sp. CNJ-927]|uniref:oligosaccharide flippase family protein n=1 Tax=Serinicoccus sp. CNJ-927 TaxID=1904970 RepID=UPI00117B9DCE|nr:polysaccharide biosynthesis C-terminal domain-containing protein [Serinicoccus sp. CNJ-927]